MKDLISWSRKILVDEKGGVMIIVAFLLFFVFLGMVALSVDTGYLYLQRRHQQSTADAAALAAAWELPWDNSAIRTTAEDYVRANYIEIYDENDNPLDGVDVSVTPPDGDIRKVKVEITKEYPLFFAAAPPIGQTEADVYAMAVATIDLPGLDLLPFNVTHYEDGVPIGEKYRFHDYPETDEPVYRTDDENDKPKKDEHYELVDGKLSFSDGLIDWANNKCDFKKVLLDMIGDDGVNITLWEDKNNGNFTLADFGDFLDENISSKQKQVQYVLGNGLDELFCLDASKKRKGHTGTVASIESSPSDDDLGSMKLSERLELDEVFFIILVKPAVGKIIHGTNNTYGIDDFLIGVVEDLKLEKTNPFTVTGTLVDVIDCNGDLDPSSEYVNVYLIE